MHNLTLCLARQVGQGSLPNASVRARGGMTTNLSDLLGIDFRRLLNPMLMP